MTSHLVDAVPRQLHINGEWVDGELGTFTVQDPATGEVITTVADASPADGLRALDAAVAAQDGWARTPARERADILHRAWEIIHSRRDDLAHLLTLEMGKPLTESAGEVAYGSEFLRWFSEEAVRIDGRYTPTPEGAGQMVITHRPVGPAYLITPWNFPLAMATRKIAPALAAGCTVIIKPASLTPLSTLALMQVLEEAGLPAGVVNVITTTSHVSLTDALLADSRLRKISFTGSTPVGVSLMKKAADNVLRSSMELGGNAPFIVFEDADLDLAVDEAIRAKFRNIGQACTAANRFLIHDAVADDFTRRLTDRVRSLRVGHGTRAGVEIGPLIEPKAVRNALRLVEEARAAGAVVATGGNAIDGPGFFIEPTVVDRVSSGMSISIEEIFAPIVAIQRFSTEDEAVRLANATEFGLVAYVFTQDNKRGRRMIDLIDTGMMGLNVGVISNAAAPFGGVKASGQGREGGREGIHEFLETKYTLLPNPYG